MQISTISVYILVHTLSTGKGRIDAVLGIDPKPVGRSGIPASQGSTLFVPYTDSWRRPFQRGCRHVKVPIFGRLEFHHTPKHGSWLNMAEMEFSVLARACLRGRNPDADSLERAVNANVSERNATAAAINWRFTARDARRKLHRLYPCHS